MKILHIISSLEEKYGGPSILLPELSLKQKEKNNEVEILTTFFNKKEIKNYSQKKIKLRFFKVFSTYRISLKLFFWLLFNLRNYDCIHVHSLYRYPCDLTILLSLFQRKSLVFSPHGALDPYLFNKSQFKLVGLFFKKLIHLILNLPLRKSIFHFTAENEKKVCMVGNLVSKSFIIPPLVVEMKQTINLNKNFLKDHLSLSKESFLIGYIGRLHGKKNIDSLIRGFNLISNFNLKLVIIGPGEIEYKKYLEKIIYETKNKNIYLMDSIPHADINKYMYGLDLYALPSHSENFGISILEAISLKIPVLITDKVNIYKNIEKYECGKILKNNDHITIAKAIDELVNNQESIKKMKINCSNLISTEYSWDNLIPQYITMYKSAHNK